MTLALVHSRAVFGIESPSVSVEVHITNGLPGFSIVGLPETAVKESRDRVRSAILSSHYEFPLRRIVVNLAPADIPKEGGRFDLPIALGILLASDQLKLRDLDQYEFIGELSLGGALKQVPASISAIVAAHQAHRTMILPMENAADVQICASISSLRPQMASSLLHLCEWLAGENELSGADSFEPTAAVHTENIPDLKDVKGQKHARRALEIAAAGKHNLLFFGPPGTGKSMLASRLPSIMPPLDEQNILQTAAIHSLDNRKLRNNEGNIERPFRSPHHSASAVALVGGGSNPRPGEISLAHNGVLFMDELPEFSRHVLEMLREPLETGEIRISRAKARLTFPADFQLVAAMNPCPCGYYQDGTDRCECSPAQVSKYRNKVSGPLLDRIDLHVLIDTIPLKDLQKIEAGETSEAVARRVRQCADAQLERQGTPNAKLSGRLLRKFCELDSDCEVFLSQALDKLQMSARSYDRTLRVARTIADMSGLERIEKKHLAEALGYRQLSR